MNALPELTQQTPGRSARPPVFEAGETLARLRAGRGGPVHIIDPFKIPQREAQEKAAALDALGFPAILLASTDYASFEDRMEPYIAALREVTSLPLLLHFPPRKGIGFPLAAGADAVLLPALLGSTDDYYVWKSYLETLLTMPGRLDRADWPELLLTAALTFGEDRRTGALLGTVPVGTKDTAQLDGHLAVIRSFGFQMVYLYSRCSSVPTPVVRRFRDLLAPDQLLFVSGNVRARHQVSAYLAAGADFVCFAGALEHPDWRTTLQELTGADHGPAGADRLPGGPR
ncbi:beta/alpha barrel domain-containing protein [Streptomyces yaizuensis]|uniref:Geranylgeranylglyceryl/heptaprenylglyceryl phosphate synthase n=1 Tax=Streptomyces yaizuensis TaxID=2989713 RepID=A0ABQ5NRE1_9ACTN|nr:geranylgeranylglyceryl/heptaprenylglyceryl phosphate synthase [Streptomyces sp. YSPA8]GLF92724.1 geranylgeranylglyceryl/heptaprenylglyceryl phosphate synthase [Streptomyces sp. YSPA8]